jgi:hypothetical protein
MRGRISRFSSEQIAQIVAAVSEYGSKRAPEHLPFEIAGQLCMYYWRKANPNAPVKKRPKKSVA